MEAERLGLQAGEERRGSNASEAVDCCLEQVFALGADQARSKFEVMCPMFFFEESRSRLRHFLSRLSSTMDTCQTSFPEALGVLHTFSHVPEVA